MRAHDQPGQLAQPTETQKKLKFAWESVAPVVHVRPIRTYYYDKALDKTSDWASRSRASTLHNAIRAAIMHVLQKTAGKAEFYTEDGVRIGWVRRTTTSKIEVMHTSFLQ